MRRLASAFESPSSNGSPASSLSVFRYDACAPVIGSSPVFQSAGSFSVFVMSLMPRTYPHARGGEHAFVPVLGSVSSMDPRALARQVAYGRIALGAALAVAPRVTARGWIGGVSATTGARVVARGLGARDVALGAGALNALQSGGPAREWLLAGAVGDVGDLAATLIAGRELPALGRFGVAALAATGAGLSLWAARGLDAPAQPAP